MNGFDYTEKELALARKMWPEIFEGWGNIYENIIELREFVNDQQQIIAGVSSFILQQGEQIQYLKEQLQRRKLEIKLQKDRIEYLTNLLGVHDN